MIVELGAVAGLYYANKWFKAAPMRDIKRKWGNILQNCKVDGIRNREDETFKITSIYPKMYGYLCCVNIPKGLSIVSLEKAKKVIEDNLNCIVDIEKGRFKEYITVKIVNKILEFEYAPVDTKSHELFIGYKLDGTRYILNLNKDPHILIAGKTGTGKSFLFASILANLIYHNSKDIDIYLLQVMKGEIDIFQNCPGVKFTSDNKNEILIILEKLSGAIHKRSKQFAEHGIKNITQWNQHFPNKKMKRIIIGVEEIAFFMDEENECFEYFTNIVKAGRSVGIHLICLTQRTTSANLGGNGELKSQLTILTARQRSELDSKNAIDIPDAAYLEKQEFISSCNDGYIKFKAPTIDEDFKILNKYVPEIKIPERTKIIKEKPSIRGGWHRPSAEEWKEIRDNIPLINVPKKQEPAGKLPPVKKGKKNGVISLSEVKTDVNA